MTTAAILVDQIKRTRLWTKLLIEDLSGEEWFFQPQPGMQHVFWICGHLAGAQDTLLFQRCLNAPRLAPEFRDHFQLGGPVKSPAEHDYPSLQTLHYTMDEMQAATEDAVSKMSDALLAEPAPGKDGGKHPHYDTKLGAVEHIARHEAFHAGQIAIIRRLLGKSFLR